MSKPELRTFSLFPLLLFALALHGQELATTRGEFKASIDVLQANSAQWRKLIDKVDINDLSVGYSTGKVYEDGKRLVLADLQDTLSWGNKASQSGKLFDEINYLLALRGLQKEIELADSNLLEFTVPDKAMTDKVQNWALAMNQIATNSLGIALKTSYTYTMQHALEADKACPGQ